MEEQKELQINSTSLADNRTANLMICHSFLGQGIQLLNLGNLHVKKTGDDGAVLTALGKMTVGMTCLAQGFELLLSIVIDSEKFKYNPKSQHDIVGRFRFLLAQSNGLGENLTDIMKGLDAKNTIQTAIDQMEILENGFFKSRYFGVSKNRINLEFANPKLAGAIAMSIAATYPMLLPHRLAFELGYNVKKDDTRI